LIGLAFIAGVGDPVWQAVRRGRSLWEEQILTRFVGEDAMSTGSL
jgi:hypothetical protein